jgi:drug/metabolite transporter (DMT)-like permease
VTQYIFLIVLLAAVLDAAQHALIKSPRDAFAMSLVVAIAAGGLAVGVLVVTGLPDAAAYPWLVGSICLGCLYWVALGAAYQTGTLATVFPISRGAGVLLTTIGATLVMGETLLATEIVMVGAVMAGLMLVAINGPTGGLCWVSVAPSLRLALIIAAFVLVDVAGVRASGSPVAYCAALYLGNAVGVGIYALAFHRHRIAKLGPRAVLPALCGAALSLLAYTLILYGMKHAPVATVAALSETSIVFAGLFSVFWLREPARFGHLAGLSMVAFGVFVLRLTT